MADCNFSINFSGAASDTVAKIRTEIENQGGIFNGDETSGTFSVKVMGSTIAGSYNITGQQINIAITEKPFFVGCNQIENFIKSYIG